jgi:hypothetical protein
VIALTCEKIARSVLGEPTKRSGEELLWCCRNHSDEHESLSINPTKDVFLCAPCGAAGTSWQLAAFLGHLDPSDKLAITKWLNEHGLLNGDRPREATNGHVPCVATYVYRDADGNQLARKLRFEPGVNGQEKEFAWERFENRISGVASKKLPLYRLREIQSEQTVILTEGEKDADAGAAVGFATTTSGGAGTFRPDHAEALRGKDIVIVVDADQPGRDHAQKVAMMLKDKAASIKVCEIPGSKDLAEAIEKGVPKNVLVALFEESPAWRPTFGCEILDLLLEFVRRFVSLYESHARVIALFVAHTHALDAADCTPYLAVTSAEKASGKTRLLEVLRHLVFNPWLTGRVSPAVLTRKVDDIVPSLLLDESDAAFGSDKDYAEVLRGILNTGYRRSGVSSLCVGQGTKITYKDFSTFCPKVIAGIGELPDTVADRSIPIRLQRAQRRDVEKFRDREVEAEAIKIKTRVAAWCKTNVETLRDARPEIPEQLSDRQADCVEPLLAIADLAGGDWPARAREALIELCAHAQADDQSDGVRLLADVRQIFNERAVDRLSSEDLVGELVGIETSPWAEWSRGKPLTKVKLARMLGRFGIAPGTIRVQESTPKGYYRRDFDDAFSRYLSGENRNNATKPVKPGLSPDFESATAGSGGSSPMSKGASDDDGCGAVAVSPSVQASGSNGRPVHPEHSND